jgi:hypothetical protein
MSDNVYAQVTGEITLDYEQHKEILTAIVFAGIRSAESDSTKVDRAKKIVAMINGEAEFE